MATPVKMSLGPLSMLRAAPIEQALDVAARLESEDDA
jgi:hypothetical protein